MSRCSAQAFETYPRDLKRRRQSARTLILINLPVGGGERFVVDP